MQYGFWELFQSVTNFRLVCLLPIVVCTYILFFLTHVLGDMKNLKKKLVCFYQYYIYIWFIQYNGDTISVISDINISRKYLSLRKRYLKSLSISIQQHTTLSFNKDN